MIIFAVEQTDETIVTVVATPWSGQAR